MNNGRIWVLMLIISINVISLVDAQMFPTCANHLLPCINYANSTKPPDFCCNVVKDLSTTHKTCICQLATPELFEGFGVKTAQAYRFLHSCGVSFDFSFCKASSPSPSLSEQPPATSGGDEGGAEKIANTGVCFMLFIWAFMLFH
ncbi:unnamed protein product [Trifolium pratense]|uniref:Uncharacterized protein n=1 Tax=Trifolium pratense TaxID=57577 RepID=A0ACB0K411_TRIPR|nr:unnamed protein product [Trifolium pratense]